MNRAIHALSVPLLLLSLAALLASCGAETVAPAPAPMPPFRHQAFYEALQGDAAHFTFSHGDWVEDYGDAAFYGLAFYAHTAAESPGNLENARAARARSVSLLDGADLLHDDINELAMSALGLIDAMAASGDRSELPVLDGFVDNLDTLAKVFGYYLEDLEDQSWAFSAYGTTAVSALVGLINVQEAFVLGGERAADRVEWAKQMAAAISEHAWNGAIYDFGGREIACIYPNVAMILLNARLFQLTGEEAYRTRALDTYRGIQAFKLPGEPVRYSSPYSAAEMGAKTDDYFTLSSQNYLVFALMTLSEITGDAAYLLEADSVLDTLSMRLQGAWCLSDRHEEACAPVCAGEGQVCVVDACTADTCQDGILHHWIDGRPAARTDPEYFCSGCNLQLLYVMWYRQHLAR